MSYDYRASLVTRAESLLGIRGQSWECDLIFADAAPCYAAKSHSGKHWCGITVLHLLRSEGLTDATWRDGIGFIGPVLGWGAATKDPHPGDVCYVDAPYQHHAIVVRVTADEIETIDANTGPTPGIVARKVRARGARGVLYYSIAKLIAAAEKRDNSPTDPAPPVEPYLPVRTLRKGCRGEDVRAWQRRLLELDPKCLPVWGADADFGDETEAATIEFQKRHGLGAGEVDERTRKAAGL